MSERLSKNFQAWEFRCHCCGRVKVDEKLTQGLQKLRDKIARPITVTSGFRCDNHNKDVGGATNSLHLTGQAADITCDMPILMLYYHAISIPEFRDGGVGLYPDKNIVHVDVRNGRTRWGQVGGEYCSVVKALDYLKGRKKDHDTKPDFGAS